MIPFLPVLFANSSMVFSPNGLRVLNLTFQYPSSSSSLIRISGLRLGGSSSCAIPTEVINSAVTFKKMPGYGSLIILYFNVW